MVDERRLQLGEYLDVTLGGHALMRQLRVVGGEGRVAELPREVRQPRRTVAGRKDQQVTTVELVTPLFVTQGSVRVDRWQGRSSSGAGIWERSGPRIQRFWSA